MKKIIKKNPVLIYGLIGLVLSFSKIIFDVQYDSEGIAGIAFILSEVFGLPFWVVSELVFTFDLVDSSDLRIGISFIGGIVICVFLDFLIRRFQKNQDNRKLR